MIDAPVSRRGPLAELAREAVCVVEADLDAVAVDAALAQRARRVPLAPRQAEVAHAAVAPRARVFWKERGNIILLHQLFFNQIAQHPKQSNMQLKHEVPIPQASNRGSSLLSANAPIPV